MPEYVPPGGDSNGSSPLTTKGDIYGFSTIDARIPIGVNGRVLTADSTQATGVKWGVAGGSGTLDDAYNQGEQITADANPVEITVPNNSNNRALDIVQNDITTNPSGMKIFNRGTGAGLEISQENATASTNGDAIFIADHPTNSNGASIRLKSGASTNGYIKFFSSGFLLETAGNTGVEVAEGLKVGVSNTIVGAGMAVGTLNDVAAKGLAVGDEHDVAAKGLAVGNSHDVSGKSLAVGDSCNTAENQLALGDGADSSQYSGAVIALANDNSVAGTFSQNTVVIDASNNSALNTSNMPNGASALAGSAGIGNIYLDTGAIFSGSADYAEMFEWNDGNTSNADRRGFFVSLTNGNKIVPGNGDVIGVVSARPVVVGDAAELTWKQSYLTDEFGSPLFDRVDGRDVPRRNPNFNPSLTYTPRRARKEWGIVGLVGKLYVRSAQVLSPGSRCTANSGGYAVAGNDYRVLQVIRQATSTQYGIIEILMK